MNYISTIQASKIWNISPTRITVLAKQGRIPGAVQIGTRWMIPQNAQKPVDARTKNSQQQKSFRFPLFAGKNANLFTPPLTQEELQLKSATESFFACNFEEAETLLADLPEKTEDLYIKIASLDCKCMISFILNQNDKFFDAYEKMASLLQKDFPYKKEMSVFLHELDATLGVGTYFNKKFTIEANYNYHESFLSHLATLPLISLFYTNTKHFTLEDLNCFETNCILTEHLNSPIDSQTIHLYLGFLNNALGQKENSIFHYKKALEIAEKYNFFWLPAVQYYYLDSFFEPALTNFSHEFTKHLQTLSDDIHKRYTKFVNSTSTNCIFKLIAKKKYLYIVYAIHGYNNKEIAELLQISEKTVSKNYSSIYEALGISNKKELLEFYFKSINS